VREALEGELTLAGKLLYKGIDRSKRMQFLSSKIPNSNAILGTVTLRFIAEFVKPSLHVELKELNAPVRLSV
jgi:hypothetical protein